MTTACPTIRKCSACRRRQAQDSSHLCEPCARALAKGGRKLLHLLRRQFPIETAEGVADLLRFYVATMPAPENVAAALGCRHRIAEDHVHDIVGDLLSLAGFAHVDHGPPWTPPPECAANMKNRRTEK